jgi:hypothetical protein
MSGVEKFVNVEGACDGGPYACPCCGFVTLPERAGYEICPVCLWEDDGQSDHDADTVRGGPNGRLIVCRIGVFLPRWPSSWVGEGSPRPDPHTLTPERRKSSIKGARGTGVADTNASAGADLTPGRARAP